MKKDTVSDHGFLFLLTVAHLIAVPVSLVKSPWVVPPLSLVKISWVVHSCVDNPGRSLDQHSYSLGLLRVPHIDVHVTPYVSVI